MHGVGFLLLVGWVAVLRSVVPFSHVPVAACSSQHICAVFASDYRSTTASSYQKLWCRKQSDAVSSSLGQEVGHQPETLLKNLGIKYWAKFKAWTVRTSLVFILEHQRHASHEQGSKDRHAHAGHRACRPVARVRVVEQGSHITSCSHVCGA